MSDSGIGTTVRIQRCLAQLGGADAAVVRGELLGHARRRLVLLADRMFARFPLLHPWEQSDDVFQEAMIRLWQSLDKVGPTTAAAFMGLAALEMRRTLRDLARDHFGRKKDSKRAPPNRLTLRGRGGGTIDDEPEDRNPAPDDLACWSEFHEAAGMLPEPQRTAFDLIYYHGLPHTEVAQVMDVTERQVRRYWQSARRELHHMLEGLP
jgi:RNA polymerase sigma-70 factor (ECF subfamily)